jgi:hypothetical protein
MINFRFHLVSLTAVFLALALGIALGATVVDQKTVTTLRSQVNRVDRRLDGVEAENGRLRAQVGQWDAFGREEDGKGALVQGRLSGVHVLVIASRGTDADPLAKLRATLVGAGAALEGTVWFTSKLRLDPANPSNADDVRTLAGALGKADGARQAALHRLATSWAGSDAGTASNPLQALVSDHFLDYEPTPTGGLPLSSIPQSNTMFVIASSAGAEVPNELVAVPFATELAQAAADRVLAVEPAHESPAKGQPPLRAAFVGPLRQGPVTTGRLSTVDDLEDVRGRVASVLALLDLGRGKVGHYGLGPGAASQLPAA